MTATAAGCGEACVTSAPAKLAEAHARRYNALVFQLKPYSRRETDFEALALGVAALMLPLAWSWNLWRGFWPIPCPLKAITALPCVTCGGTRAVHAWMHGHWGEAFAMNPLVAAGATGFIAYLAYALFCVLSRPSRRLRFTGLDAATPRPVRLLTIGFLMSVAGANWIYLVLAGR